MLLGTYNEEVEKQTLCEEAEARGFKIGEAKGIRALIDTLLEFDYASDEILSILQKKLKVTEQQAEDYLKKFYDGSL